MKLVKTLEWSSMNIGLMGNRIGARPLTTLLHSGQLTVGGAIGASIVSRRWGRYYERH